MRLKKTSMASRPLKGDRPGFVKFVGKAMQPAYHGAMGVDQTFAFLVKGAHHLFGGGVPMGKGFGIIGSGPGNSLFFYSRGYLLKSMEEKGFFNKRVVEKQGGTAIVLTSFTSKIISGGGSVPGFIHGEVNIGKQVK